MKFTLNDCLARVNQALNYPAVTYEDIYHFFDHAISELNTSLKIALPSVSEMRYENTFRVSESENVVLLTTSQVSNVIPSVESKEKLPAGAMFGYVCPNWTERTFYKNFGTASNPDWKPVTNLYGICEGTAYVAVAITRDGATWAPVPNETVTEFDLQDYLPMDWWTLFVIPYVCFKFSVRNGDSGMPFSDEYSQGYQQLQTSYNVPNYVQLSTVAGRNAYKALVEEYVADLRHCVPTRAIYTSMRGSNTTLPTYGGFYQTGGWGI